MMGGRSWWYSQQGKSNEIDFSSLYRTCEGTILYSEDCGQQRCGSASCCHSTGPESHIWLLPKEIEYQLSLPQKPPFHAIGDGRYHCAGNAACNYPTRPLDCRSYPYFPAVIGGDHFGYFDLRQSYGCPLSPEIELRKHLDAIHVWWSRLLTNPEISEWVEQTGRKCRGKPIVPNPQR